MVLHKLFLFSLLALLPLQTATNSKQELNDQLYDAVRKGDVAAVTAALDRGADVNAKFRYGATALFKAAERGHTEVAKLLLDRGADVKVKDTFYGATAMTWALDNDHYEIVSMLLQKGADGADDVLMSGTRASKADVVKVALDSGRVTPQMMTMALAVSEGNDKNAAIVEMLKKAGAVPPMVIEPAVLQSYVGKYKADPGPEIVVTIKDGKLFASLGRDGAPLMAFDKITFKPLGFGGITLTFNVEADKVTGMAFKQGQNTTQMKRIE